MPETLAPPAGDVDRCQHGTTARELLRRGGNQHRLGAAQLERWLVDAGFAETNGQPGRLIPTSLGNWVGGSLGFLGD